MTSEYVVRGLKRQADYVVRTKTFFSEARCLFCKASVLENVVSPANDLGGRSIRRTPPLVKLRVSLAACVSWRIGFALILFFIFSIYADLLHAHICPKMAIHGYVYIV